MANTQAPFGFEPYRGTGSTPTYEQVERKISSSYTTAIYTGDPVASDSTGYITQFSAGSGGTGQIAGIFVGCKYLNTALGRTVWQPYWPGSGATGDVSAYIVNDPNAQFKVQAGGASTAIGFADININVSFGYGTGNTLSGVSGAYADQTTLATTNTLPFRVVGLIQDPPGSNGTDITTGYNYIVVAFNNVDTKSLAGT